ncbi:MAG TPA: hypothetical protein VFK79_11985 [Xanthobacteraceae bacterium]|nr:hypothetical protein [Xanthobacteraceae bacterium]
MTTLHQMLRRLCMNAAAVFVLLLATLPAYSVPVIVQGYYEEQKARSCSAVTSCAMSFSAVPAGKLLTIKHVSCKISAGGSAALSSALLSINFRHTYLTPVLIVTSSTRTWYAGGEMLRLAEEGIAPSISVSFVSSTNYSMACVLTGQITP